VLGLLFLRYSEKRFVDAQKQLQGKGKRTVTPQSYQRLGVVYLPDNARFSHLLNIRVAISNRTQLESACAQRLPH